MRKHHRKRIYLALTTTLSLLLTACSGDDGAGPEQPDDRIGADGGTVTLADGAVTLVIPAGALTEPVEFTATRLTNPTSSIALIPGTAWDLGPDGLEFAKPVRLTLKYDRASVPAALVEESLAIAKELDGGWVLQGEAVVDTNAATVTASIEGFSQFGLVGTRLQLTVQTTTDGEDPDRDGYVIGGTINFLGNPELEDEVEPLRFGPADSKTLFYYLAIHDLSLNVEYIALDMTLELDVGTVQKNCKLQGSNTRFIDTSEFEPHELFAVHCTSIPVAGTESIVHLLKKIIVLDVGEVVIVSEGEEAGGPAWNNDPETGESTIEHEETDADGATKIKSVKPDGTDKKTVVDTGSGDDHSVHIRPPHRYYSSAGDIERSKLDGSERTKLTSGADYDLNPIFVPGLGIFFLRILASADHPFQALIFRITPEGQLVGPLTSEFAFSFSRPAIMPPGILLFARHPSPDRIEVSRLDLKSGGLTDVTQGESSSFFLDPAVGAGGRGAMSRIDAEGNLRLLINRDPDAFNGGGIWMEGPADVFQPAWRFPAEINEAAMGASAAARVAPAPAAVPNVSYRLVPGEAPPALQAVLERIRGRIPAELLAKWDNR